jgi:hypothetical protein
MLADQKKITSTGGALISTQSFQSNKPQFYNYYSPCIELIILNDVNYVYLGQKKRRRNYTPKIDK